ncbi:MAG: outer membrane lipoprotein LolB [Candidatus Kentron sp. G]|nr:MAG: outer membrane lipoprotein LolB [Candidatus Kentron sp. G]
MQYFSVLAVGILLTACSLIQELPWTKGEDIDPAWQDENHRLLRIRDWSVRGRIAIETGKEAWNVGVHWHQQGNEYRIRFHGPFASGSAEIVGGPGMVTLRTTDQRHFSAPDPESLLSDMMGWSIPVSGLRYWVLGRPDPKLPIEQLRTDSENRLRSLEQSGWQIRYIDYRGTGNFQLPVWLTLENARLAARIRISAWTLAPRPEAAPGAPPRFDPLAPLPSIPIPAVPTPRPMPSIF